MDQPWGGCLAVLDAGKWRRLLLAHGEGRQPFHWERVEVQELECCRSVRRKLLQHSHADGVTTLPLERLFSHGARQSRSDRSIRPVNH
eukprot:scaffold44750_cov54-Phaeocystis_antarctica.AAC.3